jgi:hypothetical protein
LKELQKTNKEYVVSALEAKTGKMHTKFGKSGGKDEPKEWRAWSKMSEWEKKEAFESLRVRFMQYWTLGSMISVPDSHTEVEKGIRARRNHTAV